MTALSQYQSIDQVTVFRKHNADVHLDSIRKRAKVNAERKLPEASIALPFPYFLEKPEAQGNITGRNHENFAETGRKDREFDPAAGRP
jgi:hypothetical protein